MRRKTSDELIEEAVVKFVEKIHPEDIGEEKLSEDIKEKMDRKITDVKKTHKYSVKVFGVWI